MKIPNPKCKYGDTVQVLNYRYKPARWTAGECRSVSYKDGFGVGFSWFYEVYVEKVKGYFVYVGDEKIKKK